MTNTNTAQTSSPSVFYAVEGSPNDYRFVLRGADLVLIDHGNVEHVFLFVGNIMSIDGQVEMRFSSGVTLHSEDLFNRSEMADIQTVYEEELEWDAKNEEGEQKEGNTPLPDGQDVPQSDMEAKDVQAAPIKNLKQQLMHALQDNENTSRQISEEIPNRNRWPMPNTNTSDKQGSADDVKPGEVPRALEPPIVILTDDTNSGYKLDAVTNFTLPHFQGTADPGATVTLYVDNRAMGTTIASASGQFLFQLDQPLEDGPHSVWVQAAKFGLTAPSNILPLEIDTTPPLLPSINLAKVSDRGWSSTDKITNDTWLTFEGKFAPGEAYEPGMRMVIEVTNRDGTVFRPVGAAVVRADGTWSGRLDQPLKDAWGYVFQLSAEDEAGNRTLPFTSVVREVSIDTACPPIDSAWLVGDTFNPAMEGTEADFITSNGQFGLSGIAEAWSISNIYIDNVLVGTVRATGEDLGGSRRPFYKEPGTLNFGALSVPGDNTSLADGTYVLTIVPTDRPGNLGKAFQAKLVIDTTIDAPAMSIGNLIDSSDDTLFETGVKPEFTVRGASNSTGEFTLVDAATGLPVATPLHFRLDPDAQSHTFVLPEDLADGSYIATFTNMDAAGNVRSTTMSFNVDATPPVIDQVALNTESNTGSADDAANPVTKVECPVIVGVSEAGAAITVEVRDDKGTADTADDTVYVAKTVAGDDGSWSVTAPSSDVIAEGNYSVTVTATDKAGNTAVARDISFEINRQVSLVPGSFRMGEGDSPYLINTAPSFSWQALEMVTASFLFYKSGVDTPLFSITPSAADLATVDGVTTWTPSSLELPDGQYTVKAIFTDTEAGNETDPNENSVTVIVDTIPPVAPTITFDSVTADNVLNMAEAIGNVTVTGTTTNASEGDEVTLTVNGVEHTGQVDSDGNFSITVAGADLAADADMTIEASLTTSDAAGNSATSTGSHEYGVDIAPPATPTITIDPVTADNVLNATEASGHVTVTGMTTNTTEGDWVTLTVNGVENTGQVDSDGSFSIHVPGSDLAADDDTTIEASVTTHDAAGNHATGTADHAYTTTTDVTFDLSGALQDDNPGDTLTLDDVESIRATISGDLDGDGTPDSLTMDADVSETGSWSLHFSQELAVGDYQLNLSALAADGSEVALASTTDLNYDFSVLAKEMLANPDDSHVLFDETAENTEPAGSETPAPGAVDTVTIVDPHVTIEEHVL